MLLVTILISNYLYVISISMLLVTILISNYPY